jgi:hypothetical protein
MLMRGFAGGGVMRQLIAVSCTLLLFVVSFGAVYISFRTSTPPIRGIVGGGGFFLLAAFLLLWRDLAPIPIAGKVPESG